MSLKDKLKILPPKSGVYIFYDDLGKIIYVGKATNLKNRVSQYFQSSKQGESPRRIQLRSLINDVEIFVVNSPIEALILEANLIKKYRPPFNISRKDDKKYPYIEITVSEEYPKMRVVREAKNKKHRYFGPYPSTSDMRKTFKIAQKIFKIRTCKYDLSKKRLERPCLDFHIGLCSAPCVGKISKEGYRKSVEEAVRFLDGHREDLIKKLKKEMEELSEKMEYERCAVLRDLIKSIEVATSKTQIVTKPGEDADIIGYALEENYALIFLMQIRGGKLIGQFQYSLNLPLEYSVDRMLYDFITQYYLPGFFIPSHIYVPTCVEEMENIQKWLTSLKGKSVKITVPLKGEKKKILNLAMTNAYESLKLNLTLQKEVINRNKDALENLREILSLPQIPSRIEGYDISNISGECATASMVVFIHGEPYPKHYRKFKIREIKGPNDQLMMYQTLKRRFKNLKEHTVDSFSYVPDLILIDGGKPQLSAAMDAAKEEGFDNITIIALAKKNEEIYIPNRKEPLKFNPNLAGMKLLRSIRDEAHRFALSYHRKIRDKKVKVSILEKIPGISKKRKETLLTHFDSIEEIANATIYELETLPGFNRKVAEKVLRHIGRIYS